MILATELRKFLAAAKQARRPDHRRHVRSRRGRAGRTLRGFQARHGRHEVPDQRTLRREHREHGQLRRVGKPGRGQSRHGGHRRAVLDGLAEPGQVESANERSMAHRRLRPGPRDARRRQGRHRASRRRPASLLARLPAGRGPRPALARQATAAPRLDRYRHRGRHAGQRRCRSMDVKPTKRNKPNGMPTMWPSILPI